MLDWHGRLVGNVLDGYPVKVAVADAAPQTALAAPSTIGSNCHLSTMIRLRVVNVELEWPGLVSLN